MCNLSGNSAHSKTLWKILLTKVSNVLNPALDILANMVNDFNKQIRIHEMNHSNTKLQELWPGEKLIRL